MREEERLERLVDQLLQATTLDQGRSADRCPLDWAAAVAERVESFRRTDPSRVVETDLPAHAVAVVADPHVVAAVIDNLLGNVAKYTPIDSPVLVRVTVDGDVVETAVEDAGPGVPEADRERVFEKFVRLGDHLTRPQQGVGLGLYIVRRAIEAMGGTVRCEPSPTGGAAFVVRVLAATTDLSDVADVTVTDAAVAAPGATR